MGATQSILCDKNVEIDLEEVAEVDLSSSSEYQFSNVEVDRIEVSVTEVVQDSHSDYHFLIRCAFRDNVEHAWTSNPTVSRSVGDFNALRRRLLIRHPDLLVPPTPDASPRLLQGYFSPSQIISYLATDATNFVTWCIKQQEISCDGSFVAFLLVGETEWQHLTNELKTNHPCKSKANVFDSGVAAATKELGEEQAVVSDMHKKLVSVAEAVESIEVCSWDAIENTGACSPSEGPLLAALDAFISTSATNPQEGTSDAGVFGIGRSFKTAQHFALLALHFEAGRCGRWVKAGLDVTLAGGRMLRAIHRAMEAAEGSVASFNARRRHQDEVQSAEQKLLELDAEGRSSVSGTAFATVACGQTLYHEYVSSLHASKSDVDRLEMILSNAIKRYDDWKVHAFSELEMLNAALSEVAKNIVLRWVELERCRLLEHAEKYGTFVLDVCTPVHKSWHRVETEESREKRELESMIGAPAEETFVGDVRAATIRRPIPTKI